MTVTMRYDEYNKMLDFAKQFAAKPGTTHPMAEYIRLTVTGDTAKAEALDGLKMGETMLHIGSNEGEGTILLPVTNKLKKSDVFAAITQSEKEIEIKTATGARIYRKPEGDFFDTAKIWPTEEPQEVFGFDPKLLADALKAFDKNAPVKIKYRGALKPLVIESSTGKALVMPTRLNP